MTLSATTLRAFLSAHPTSIVAELTAVRGSSPREAGAFMLIAADTTIGTIGGGALEYLVIARARNVLRDGLPDDTMDIPLGPEIGQCCGGRVEVSLRAAGDGKPLVERLERVEAERPHVFLFGAGHVGQALARALAALPVKVHVIDTRPDELADLPANVEAKALAMPEAAVRSAPEGSSYVILTHDHALDFLIAAEALKRTDAPYVGMVGSRTKRARFRSWYLAEAGGTAAAVDRLVLPIGGRAFPDGLGDKRPEVIAALAAAEILVQIGTKPSKGPVAGVAGMADGR
jgi:xanthine dehydrogenase accessory factor